MKWVQRRLADTAGCGHAVAVAARTKRLLAGALGASVTVAAVAPYVVRLVYGSSNANIIIVAWAMTIVPAACIVATLAQQRWGTAGPRFFREHLLAVASIMLAFAALALCGAGLIGVMLDLLLVPIAVMMLLIGWAQPKESDLAGAVILGVGLTPLVAWFAGRADEYLSEALLSGGLIVVVFGLLIVMRRRGEAGNPL
jgi:hypothetical protein